MIPLLVMMKNASGAAPSGISVDVLTSNVFIDKGSCACSWQAAHVNVDWFTTGFDSGLHEYVLTKDGVELYRGNFTTFDDVVVSEHADPLAYVDGTLAVTNFWNADWDYRVDIVRVSDGAVLASRSRNYTNVFGRCDGEFC